jgi:perosamine synthetase
MDKAEQSRIIPIFRPAISDDEIAAVESVMRSLWLGAGQQVNDFETEFAALVQARHAVSTNSGTAALTAALTVLGVGPGDEVILPSFTFISAFHVITALGATPVFADIEREFLTLDPADVKNRLTPNTKLIINVHHGGQLSDMNALVALTRDAGVYLVDDSAHATGAAYQDRPVGSLADISCFSFSAVKNLTTGDGGMVTTNSDELAAKLASYCDLGMDKNTWSRYGKGTEASTDRWAYSVVGMGQRMRMNDIAAAIGLVQLERLPGLNRRRGEIVSRYEESFAGLQNFRSIRAREDTTPNWHMYSVLMPDRDQFIDEMKKRDVLVGVHYYPIHMYPLAAGYSQPLPVTEDIWSEITTFPVYPDMTEDEQSRVIDATLEILSDSARSQRA